MAVLSFPCPAFYVKREKKAQHSHDVSIRLYTWPSFHLSYHVLYPYLEKVGSPLSAGCIAVRCFLTCQPMQALLRNVSQTEAMKKAVYNCIPVATLTKPPPTRVFAKAERMCKRP